MPDTDEKTADALDLAGAEWRQRERDRFQAALVVWTAVAFGVGVFTGAALCWSSVR